MTTSTSAGGSAAAGGFDYQARVAAWYASRVLAERSVGLGLSSKPTLIRCETEQAVDDLLVVFDDGGALYGQVKTALPLSRDPNSQFAGVVDQFVRQCIANAQAEKGAAPWNRPVDDRDRLVLLVGPNCPGTVSRGVKELLDRLRSLPFEVDPVSLPLTDEERERWDICASLATAAWERLLGCKPTTSEVRSLFRLVHVVQLALGTSEGDAEAVLNVLRGEILLDASKAESAWDALATICLGFCRGRTGADRNGLASAFRSRGIVVRPAPSYAQDIARLTGQTRAQLAVLASYASIRVGTQTLHAERACTRALAAAAEEGDVVVVGEPGAGKSAVLHDFVKLSQASDNDVVLLCADQLDARSVPALRGELGLEHELLEVLAAWPGESRGYLVIDALDAARAEVTARTLRNLISGVEQLKSRWSVVVSIRKFDLRYSQELSRLFAGTPPSPRFVDPEFGRVRHLNIPPLTDDELGALLAASDQLRELVRRTQEPLKSLARRPFYLFLLAQLLDAGLSNEELSATRTALELLDRFWAYRVLREDRRGAARESLLLRVCDLMMDAQRLHVDRMAVAVEPTAEVVVDDLLSTNLLTERHGGIGSAVDRYALTFAHHIFFDYSVARLSFRSGAESLERRLRQDPSLALTVRPSIQFVFHRLWLRDAAHTEFWACLLALCAGDTPILARLVGSTVAAREAMSVGEFDPLLDGLSAHEAPIRAAAEDALRHVVALIVDDRTVAAHEVWPALADRIMQAPTVRSADSARILLSVLTDREDVGSAGGALLASASRALLAYALSVEPRSAPLIRQSIRATARTVPWAPDENVAALSAILVPTHVRRWGYEELFWLAREMEALVARAPEFVRDVYLAAFGYKETSREPTAIGDSQIMGLRSHRAQDFEGALYQLSELFPAFLRESPFLASTVLAFALNEYVRREHRIDEDERVLRFELMGMPIRSCVDFSSIWDAGDTYGHDGPVRLLNAWDEHVRQHSNPESTSRIEDLVRGVAAENAPAVVWKRLLIIGSELPREFAPRLCPLLESEDILTGLDTSAAAGEMLKTAFPELSDDHRRRIEAKIVGIASNDPDKDEYANRLRLRLLNCIPKEMLQLSESRQLLAKAERNGPLPANRMPTGPKFTSRPYGEAEYLAEQGVPVEHPANAELRALEAPVAKFASDHLNVRPSGEAFESGLKALTSLADGLRLALVRGAHPAQIQYAETVLAQGASAAAKHASLDSMGAAPFVTDLLLQASASVIPLARNEDVFDTPSWGPAPRIEAAEGLLEISRFASLISERVIAAIRKLSDDPVPAVRFQVAIRLEYLRGTNDALFWELVSKFCAGERTRGVLSGVLRGGLSPGLQSDANTAIPLVRALGTRVSSDPRLKDLEGETAILLADAYVTDGGEVAGAFVKDLLRGVPATAKVVGEVCGYLREALVYGGPGERAEPAATLRKRAVEVVTEAAQRARDILAAWRETPGAYDHETIARVARLVDSVAAQMYFAAGGGSDRSAHEGSPNEQSRRMYVEARPALEAIADAGVPSATHYLMQMLELLVECDPPGVFRLVARSVIKGRDAGYEYESLGVDVAVRILERYLADHRDVFRIDRGCREELIPVLDTFVRAGWPSARRLANSLEGMFQ